VGLNVCGAPDFLHPLAVYPDRGVFNVTAFADIQHFGRFHDD
jgi:hypothetical protein